MISRKLLATAAGACLMVSATAGHAQSLRDALSATYENNPTLNAARAELRGVDENVPQALAGWRPQISVSASSGMRNVSDQSYFTGGGFSETTVGMAITQPLFRGFRTVNSTRQAESIVFAQREDLRVSEQTALLQAATAYMDVIRDTGIVALRRSDLKFQEELVRASNDRFSVGEGTRTDVAQAEAGRARSQSALNAALANLNTSRAVFRQVIGLDPKNLSPKSNVATLIPKSVSQAIAIGQEEHPSIMSAMHFVDAAIFAVKTAEGTLLPSVELEGSLQTKLTSSNGRQPGANGTQNAASIFGRVTIPIYQQGAEYSTIRQAKEDLGRTEILVDVARDTVRAEAISAWGRLNAAEGSISAAQAEVSAAQLALEGVIEEQRVGQRTTLDVLDSQSDLVDARVTLITAQRDKVVAAYALLATVGRLTHDFLGLTVPKYDPREHYNAVRDKWIGLRTPDGR